MKKNISGFTLVELAIVIVIIGLLVGGVLQGQELINQAAISNDIAKFDTIRSASETFRAKYGQLPGDLDKTTTYWPDCVDLGDIYGQGVDPYIARCNGNGDGLIAITEAHYFYYELSQAGLIPGHYIATITSNDSMLPKLKTTGQDIAVIGDYLTAHPSDTFSNWFNFPPGNAFISLAQPDGPLSIDPANKESDPAIHSAIDTKLDDGNGATGNMREVYNPGFFANTCTDANGNYRTDTHSAGCVFMLKY